MGIAIRGLETFEKCHSLFQLKKDEKFTRSNNCHISRNKF